MNAHTFTLPVPVQVPTVQETTAMLREEMRRVCEERCRYLSIGEAADYLRLSRTAFYDLRRRYNIPVSQVGSGLFDREDLDVLVSILMTTAAHGKKVVEFPSLQRRKAAVAAGKYPQSDTGVPPVTPHPIHTQHTQGAA